MHMVKEKAETIIKNVTKLSPSIGANLQQQLDRIEAFIKQRIQQWEQMEQRQTPAKDWNPFQ